MYEYCLLFNLVGYLICLIKITINLNRAMKKQIILFVLLTVSHLLVSQISLGVKLPKLKKEDSKSTETKSESSNEMSGKESKKILANYSDDQLTKILSTNTTSEYANDKESLEDINVLYANGKVKYSDAKNMSAQLEGYNAYKLKADGMKSKYEEFWKVYEAKNGKKEETHSLHETASSNLDTYINSIKIGYTGTYESALKYYSEAEKGLSYFKEGKKTYDKWDSYKNLDAYIASVRNDIDNAVSTNLQNGDNNYAITKLQLGESEPKVTALKTKRDAVQKDAESIKKGVDETIRKTYWDYLAKQPMPVDKYKGADKETIKKKMIEAWKENASCKDRKVLAIALDDNWDRKKGLDDNLQMYDNSALYYEIVVVDDNDPQVARVYRSYLYKNNITNPSKIVYDNVTCLEAMIVWKMMTKNVKKNVN